MKAEDVDTRCRSCDGEGLLPDPEDDEIWGDDCDVCTGSGHVHWWEAARAAAGGGPFMVTEDGVLYSPMPELAEARGIAQRLGHGGWWVPVKADR